MEITTLKSNEIFNNQHWQQEIRKDKIASDKTSTPTSCTKDQAEHKQLVILICQFLIPSFNIFLV